MQGTIVFAGGCFWGVEHYFRQIRGVLETTAGYANGCLKNPTYPLVCSGTSGFAEAVRVIYDQEKISLDRLIDLYLDSIDPLSFDRQGPDVGEQYRTGIYTVSEKDLDLARSKLDALGRKLGDLIAVEALPLINFYPAEEYHQRYLEKNPNGYCHLSASLFQKAREANT